jgi:hypothetical protein
MAMGVAAISRFMMPKLKAPVAAATMNTGWRMISPSGRPCCPAFLAGNGGKVMNDSASMPRSATPASAM